MQIDFVTFLQHAALLVVWVFLAAGVYALGEKLLSKNRDG
jgi:hypothetical protein